MYGYHRPSGLASPRSIRHDDWNSYISNDLRDQSLEEVVSSTISLDQNPSLHTRVQADDLFDRPQTDQIADDTLPSGTDTSAGKVEFTACRIPILHGNDDNNLAQFEAQFEPVEDCPGLPPLKYKPLVLRRWTLLVASLFYLGLITSVGILYYYENTARVFNVSAAASRFTIRILPSFIGSLSTILFQSILVNFSRILPYILMAQPTYPDQKRQNARKTVFALYFPLMNIVNAFSNRHYTMFAMMFVQIYLNPFITPAKTAFIHRTATAEDPDVWKITISGPASLYLLFTYSVLFTVVMGMQVYLWDRRTGLRWDPVSLADQIMLLQGSDILADFSGLEYFHSKRAHLVVLGRKSPFSGLYSECYQLGYWRHIQTGQYWHGIRKRPSSSNDKPNTVDYEHEEPSLHNDSAEASAWWKSQCSDILRKPYKCYKTVYVLINDFWASAAYLVTLASFAGCLYCMLTDRLMVGFRIPAAYGSMAYVFLTFVLCFVLSLLNGYWYQIDLWYRQLQIYMSLRQPSPAAQNLLLEYPCDLPVLITLRALSNRHWRLALLSIMPLVARILPITAASIVSLNPTESTRYVQLKLAPLQFKISLGLLCLYLILIPISWPGPNRRLPIEPLCIGSSIVMFYDSTLVRNDAFLPRHMNEERWHMAYRLRLQERLYGFGIYKGSKVAIHVGIDDVYGRSSDQLNFRFVTPLKPPMRAYRRWLRYIWIRSGEVLRIKRQPTLDEKEMQALTRLKADLAPRS